MAGAAVSAGRQRLWIALAVPALVGIFAYGQAILDRRGWRLDLSEGRRYSLSDHAKRVLDYLPADVRVLAFVRAQDPRKLMIEDLLRQVTARSARVRVDVVDVNRSPALAREYGVSSFGALVVESEGRRRVVSNPREEVLVGALLQVTRQQRKTVGWVVGHGEGDLGDSDRRRGWSTARTLLEQEYFDVRPISLLGDDVPPGIDVLVIAGPEKDFLPEELAALDAYLQRPGQALILLEPLRAPELAAFLHRYGLDLDPDVVVDPRARLYGGEAVTMQIGFDRAHPIVAPLEAPPLFSLTRSVEPLEPDAGDTNAVAFLHTGEASWATREVAAVRTGTARFLASRDRRGPVPVGVEVAFRPVAPPGAEPRQGRIVVYGNAQFANNFFIEYLGNKDLFVNTVSWLAHEPQAIGARPLQQVRGVHQFFVSAEEGERAFWATAVAWPAVLAIRRRWS